MKSFVYENVDINVHDDVFYPTETSKIILDYLLKTDKSYASVLDLGCGSGVVTTVLGKSGRGGQFSASDICEKATANAAANLKRHSIPADVRAGSLYEPWKDSRFDLVICDVSGVAEELAKASGWFSDKVSCASGRDGTELVSRIIAETPRHLAAGGTMILPILTLSDHRKLLKTLKTHFSRVEKVASRQFYLPKDMEAHAPLVERLLSEGLIDVEKKFGLYLWKTELYEAAI